MVLYIRIEGIEELKKGSYVNNSTRKNSGS